MVGFTKVPSLDCCGTLTATAHVPEFAVLSISTVDAPAGHASVSVALPKTGTCASLNRPVPLGFVDEAVAAIVESECPGSAFGDWQLVESVAGAQPTSWVYFISDEDGYIKIGVTNSIESRVAQLQTSSRQELRLIAKVPGDFTTESELHQRFAHARVRGEWFRPAPDLCDFIKEVAQ